MNPQSLLSIINIFSGKRDKTTAYKKHSRRVSIQLLFMHVSTAYTDHVKTHVKVQGLEGIEEPEGRARELTVW